MSELEKLDPVVTAMLRRHNLLEALVAREIISHEVEKIELSVEEKKNVWDTYLTQQNLEEGEQLQEHLRKKSLTENDLHWQLELPLRINKCSKEKFIHKAEARFLRKKESLDTVIYSLIRTQDPDMARELYLRISGKEASFADLADEYSQGKEARTKGIIGPVPMTQAHPILAEKLRTSSPGQLLEPFKIENWWLVVRLERYEPAQFTDATALQMSIELFNEWARDETACIMRSLKA